MFGIDIGKLSHQFFSDESQTNSFSYLKKCLLEEEKGIPFEQDLQDLLFFSWKMESFWLDPVFCLYLAAML